MEIDAPRHRLMAAIQTEKAAMMTCRASANASKMIVERYNGERFVMKSVPLAAADRPTVVMYDVFSRLLKPHTYYVSCSSSISAAPR